MLFLAITVVYFPYVYSSICNSDNFSLKPFCNDLGFHMSKNMDIDILRSLTTLDEHVKRITVYCDKMSYCVQFKQLHASISLSDVLASWLNVASTKKVCTHIPCIHQIVKKFSCIRPIPKTVLRLVIMMCGLAGYQLDMYDEIRADIKKVSLTCLSSALVLAQYASAEAHRGSRNYSTNAPIRVGLHHTECGSHVCPGKSCPKTCKVSAMKYACLEQRCPYHQHSIGQFFSWMMGGNTELLPVVHISTKLCLQELPMKPHQADEIDIPNIDNTKVKMSAPNHRSARIAVALTISLFMIIAIVTIIAVYNRKKISPRFLPKRAQYVRMQS